MLKLSQIYLKKISLWFISFLVAIIFIIYYGIKEIYINETKKELLNDIKIASLFIKDKKNLEKNIKRLHKELNVRFTIIDKRGNILADSNKDKNLLKNHKNRPEIKEAFIKGEASVVRFSKISQRELIYVVKRVDGVIVRAAKELSAIQDAFMPIFWQISGVIVIFLFLVFYSAYRLGLDIEEEIKKIVKFLKGLTKKKKELYIESNFSKEFNQIAKLLSKVSKVLDKREKQKAKYTKRLEQSNAQKDDIISAISHEFKNPIAVIDGYAQTLLEQKDLNEALQKRFLEKIKNNTNKLSTLIDTLRLAIKLDDDKQKLRLDSFDIKELAIEVAECLKESFLQREIIVKGVNKNIKADKDLLEIVLKNLIENALKYSDDEVIVNIESDYFEVVDKGVGIKESEIEKITNKFYRVNNNRWNNSLGLGLFIVKNILELHKMRLEIISKPHSGSTFRVYYETL